MVLSIDKKSLVNLFRFGSFVSFVLIFLSFIESTSFYLFALAGINLFSNQFFISFFSPIFIILFILTYFLFSAYSRIWSLLALSVLLILVEILYQGWFIDSFSVNFVLFVSSLLYFIFGLLFIYHRKESHSLKISGILLVVASLSQLYTHSILFNFNGPEIPLIFSLLLFPFAFLVVILFPFFFYYQYKFFSELAKQTKSKKGGKQ